MNICKICKTENEDQFAYCKNCGCKIEQPKQMTPPRSFVQQTLDTSGLVPVIMELPDPFNPGQRTNQTVYVTPAQKAAILYDSMMNKREQN